MKRLLRMRRIWVRGTDHNIRESSDSKRHGNTKCRHEPSDVTPANDYGSKKADRVGLVVSE